MNSKKANRYLKRVALEHGVSISEVKSEITIAIEMAMSNTDPKIQAQWRDIPYKGEKPTPEEVITYLAAKINNEKL